MSEPPDLLTAFFKAMSDATLSARERAMTISERMTDFNEVVLVTQAKLTFFNDMGYRPTQIDLQLWASQTNRPYLATFLLTDKPHITGLFGPVPPPTLQEIPNDPEAP